MNRGYDHKEPENASRDSTTTNETQPDHAKRGIHMHASARGPKVLIADDTPSHLKLMQVLLASEPYEVSIAQDGKEVLELLKAHTPDLMILDVDMPYLSGLDVCGRARGVRRLMDVPVLLVSAQPRVRVEDQLKWVRADAFLEKPLRVEEFKRTARELLERPRAS